MYTRTTSVITNAPQILLVEDTPSQGIRFKACLEDGGCSVHWVTTGNEGLKVAHDIDFDLIVLDVQLPDITGFEVCRTLKGDPTVADVPVVMLTTRDHARDVLRGFENGAIDYIPKDPFAEAVLLETIKQMGF